MDPIDSDNEWLAAHPEVLKEHIGERIAVAQNRIVASAATGKELASKTANLGLSRCLIFKVPRESENFSLL
ncbi:hypothetical protein HY995_04455 [Candidatus Micrarchaeota archaeon]|nr:hypothetical protein [Candidatus Micrarchaeota archaeon]MBI5177307.1 hypothetical protein [Candidatus Micrarchaeota archaeon]